jgi:hypothetical protein
VFVAFFFVFAFMTIHFISHTGESPLNLPEIVNSFDESSKKQNKAGNELGKDLAFQIQMDGDEDNDNDNDDEIEDFQNFRSVKTPAHKRESSYDMVSAAAK